MIEAWIASVSRLVRTAPGEVPYSVLDGISRALGEARKHADDCPPDPAGACEWLKEKIEALSSGPVTWSRGALTARRQHHVILINGNDVPEGLRPATVATLSPRDAALATLARARALRAQIDGPALLVWRIEPEWRDPGSIYVRLSFEPDLWNDSTVQGPWTEKPEPPQTYPSKAGYAVADNGVAAVEPVQERLHRELRSRMFDW